jgi:serine acetyltransferase
MMMSLLENELLDYIIKQVNVFFPDKEVKINNDIENSFRLSLLRLEYCFKFINNSAYTKDGITIFDHLHTDQYLQFLYFWANTHWRMGYDENFSKKLGNLHRYLSGMFLSYKCELPDIFFIFHSVGTVIGNATYDNFLVISQSVTINTGDTVEDIKRPVLGKGLYLATHAKIIGNQEIGDYVSIGVEATSYKDNVPTNSVIINIKGENIVKPRKHITCFAQNFFNTDIINYKYSKDMYINNLLKLKE